MINTQEWLRTRKNLLDQVKSQVRIRLGPLSKSLREYAKSLEEDFRRGWRPCAALELDRALTRAQVVLSADFHAYSQSQRAHVRLLRDHVGERPVILALECLPPKFESSCEKYLMGKMSEADFLTHSEWDRNWGFPWENYRPLFELARDRGVTIRGLFQSGQMSLQKRDVWTAKRILQLKKEHPDHLIFVIMGEWHLAANHLPRRLKMKLSKPGEVVVLHQDVEQLYFKLALKNSEGSVDILKAPGDRFCLMVSPPWMKWQSYLMYLEHAYDRDLQEDLSIDYSDHVASLVELLEKDLRLSVEKSKLQVYCANSKTSLARLRLSLTQREEKALVYHLEHDQSFFVPKRSWLYLSRPTINHASGLAGQYLHAQLCGRTRTLWTMPRDFLPLVWVEAVGFFFSKWINPKRKAESLESLRLQLAARDPQGLGRKALLLALDHRLSEVLWVRTGRLRPSRYRPRDLGAYLDAARIVGSMLGERLFQKVRSRTISLRQLMSYLRVNMDGGASRAAESRSEFRNFYWQLVREIEHDQSL